MLRHIGGSPHPKVAKRHSPTGDPDGSERVPADVLASVGGFTCGVDAVIGLWRFFPGESTPGPVVLAMNGWDEGHPAWWLNLEAHPDAVMVAGRRPNAG